MFSKYNVFRSAFVLMLIGSFVLQAKEAKGGDNNEASKKGSIEVNDILPPSIEALGNLSGGTGDRLELSATIKDNVGVASSKLYWLNIGEDRYTEKDMEEKGDDVYTTTITLPDKVGELNYYLVARDLEGNETREPLDGTYRITVIDNKPPIIEVITLPLSSTTGEDVVVKAKILDNISIDTASLKYTPIDGDQKDVVFDIDPDTSIGSATIKVAANKVGTITYYIEAKDKAGNIARSPEGTDLYKITVVDNIKPDVSLSSDNPSDVESGDVITILGDFKDNDCVKEARLMWKPLNAIDSSSDSIDFIKKSARLKIKDDFVGKFECVLVAEDKAGNKATTPPLEVKVSKRLPRGSFFITSSPEHAKVFLDERYKGETPLKISELRPWKPFKLVLKLKDFAPWEIKTFVEPGHTTEINATLKAEGEGTVFIISSPPMAKVYIDGEFVGTTPVRDIRIEAGKHNLNVVKEGYRPRTKEIFVLNGRKVYLRFNLESGAYSEVVTIKRGL
ncbi:MAG: PEGA domain-containing protein [bacterium]|nr:PEGA domain-containing protein [bacterium]